MSGHCIARIHESYLHALAFAADEHVREGVGNFARLGEGGIRTVPARVVGIVPGGASFAVVALATCGAVHNNFVRPRQPVFINIKLHWLGGGLRFGN